MNRKCWGYLENEEEKLVKVSQNIYKIMYYLYSLEQIGVQRQTNFQENYFRMELTLCECFKILTMSLSMHGSQFVVIAFQLIYERETCNHTKVLKILKSLKLLNNAPSKVILTLCDLYLLNMCVIFFLVFSRFTQNHP